MLAAVVGVAVAGAGCGGSKPAPPVSPPSGVSSSASTATPQASGPVVGVIGKPVRVSEQDPLKPTPVPAVAEMTVVNGPVFTATNGTDYRAKSGQFVTFKVSVRNVGPVVFETGGGSWSLAGPDGSLAEGNGNGIAGTEQVFPVDVGIPPGGVVSGLVSFDGPRHGSLQFTPNGVNVAAAEWAY